MHLFGAPLALLCLIWHLIASVLSMVNYVVVIRLHTSDFVTRNTYLAFCVIGLVLYSSVAAPLFVYSYKYAKSNSGRRNRFLLGVAVMFIMSLPLCVIDVVRLLVGDPLFDRPLDGIVFILQAIGSAFGGVISWFGYMDLVARKIHRYCCYQRQITDAALEGQPAGRLVRFGTPHSSQPSVI